MTHDGWLQPCMDRPDLAIPLAGLARVHGLDAAADAWNRHVEAV